MKNLDNQIAHIESLLQEILQKTNGGSPDKYNEDDTSFQDTGEEVNGCPFCGCEDDHGDARSKALSSLGPLPRKGKTIIMISKKGKKNGSDSQLPKVIKDIMGSLMKSE